MTTPEPTPIPMGGSTPGRRTLKAFAFNYLYNNDDDVARKAAQAINRYDQKTQDLLAELANHTGIDITHIELHTTIAQEHPSTLERSQVPAYWTLRHHHLQPDAPNTVAEGGYSTEDPEPTHINRGVGEGITINIHDHNRLMADHIVDAFFGNSEPSAQDIADSEEHSLTNQPFGIGKFKGVTDHVPIVDFDRSGDSDTSEPARWVVTPELGARVSMNLPPLIVDGVKIQPPRLHVRFSSEEVEDLRLKIQKRRLDNRYRTIPGQYGYLEGESISQDEYLKGTEPAKLTPDYVQEIEERMATDLGLSYDDDLGHPYVAQNESNHEATPPPTGRIESIPVQSTGHFDINAVLRDTHHVYVELHQMWQQPGDFTILAGGAITVTQAISIAHTLQGKYPDGDVRIVFQSKKFPRPIKDTPQA